MITGRRIDETNYALLEQKVKRLTATLREQQAEAAKLDAAIDAALKEVADG